MNSGDKHCEFSHFCKLDVEEPLLAGNLLSGPLARVRGGGYNWVGVCTLPETLSLFQTKICDFPYPISDLIKNFIPYFRPISLLFVSPNDEEVASSKTHTQFKTACTNHTLFKTKMVKIGTLFQTKRLKNHTLWRRTYRYSLYKGVPPEPLVMIKQ